MPAQLDLPTLVPRKSQPASGQRRAASDLSRWKMLGLAFAVVGCALFLANRAYWEEVDALQSSTFIVTTRAQSFAGKNEPLQVALEYAVRERHNDSQQVPASATGQVAQYQFPALLRGLNRVTLRSTETRVELVRITNSAGATIARLGRDDFHSMSNAARFHGETMIVMQSFADPKFVLEWTGMNHLAMPAATSEFSYIRKWTLFYTAIFAGIGALVVRLLGSILSRYGGRHSHSATPYSTALF